MSNYPNMSYCMNQNTLLAFNQIIEAMNENGVQFLRDLSREERRAWESIFNACEDFMNLSEELVNAEQEQEGRYNDSMDGDFDSAMASAGFGTDEDYGYSGEEY